MKITATIITLNEERNIARAIESLRCCDEILIIDSGSTDRTVELAQNLGVRVIEAGWCGYSAQKNWAEWDGTAVGFDFAVAEQCAQYRECGSYVASYGRHVLAVEYGDKAFRRACRNWSDRISIVRRDVDLTTHGTRRWCA